MHLCIVGPFLVSKFMNPLSLRLRLFVLLSLSVAFIVMARVSNNQSTGRVQGSYRPLMTFLASQNILDQNLVKNFYHSCASHGRRALSGLEFVTFFLFYFDIFVSSSYPFPGVVAFLC